MWGLCLKPSASTLIFAILNRETCGIPKGTLIAGTHAADLVCFASQRFFYPEKQNFPKVLLSGSLVLLWCVVCYLWTLFAVLISFFTYLEYSQVRVFL